MMIAPAFAPRFLGSLAEAGPVAWPRYDRAMVIDFLASPGPFNTPVNVEALTPEMVRNAQASGITAVNLTIGGQTPEGVFRSIARWERDLERHPAALLKIRTVADLQTAKQQKKLGLLWLPGWGPHRRGPRSRRALPRVRTPHRPAHLQRPQHVRRRLPAT
jgi:membrane dipeptidase